MKRFFACVCLLSSLSTFANDSSAVDALTSILPLGSYQGKSDAGDNCQVSVNEVNFPEKAISVVVSNSEKRLFKVVADGSEFRFRGYKSEFIQTERFYVDDSRNAYVERIVRTVDAGYGRLYVVVANESTINRDVRQEAVECVIKVQ